MASRYLTPDGLILDPQRSERTWSEGTRWDGRNRISLATGSQWDHQALHRTRRGVWWIESWSQWQGSRPTGHVVSDEDACRWLLVNGYDPDGEDFPAELRPLVDEVLA